MVIMSTAVIGGLNRVDLVWLAASTASLKVFNYSQLSHYTVQLQL